MVVQLAFCTLAALCLGIALLMVFKQKQTFDHAKKELQAEISIPFIGKIKSATPSVLICFIAIAFAFFAYDTNRHEPVGNKEFIGTIVIDKEHLELVDKVNVGLTSSLWYKPTAIEGEENEVKVTFQVPNNWPSYHAYAYPTEDSQLRGEVVGASLESGKFRVRIRK